MNKSDLLLFYGGDSKAQKLAENFHLEIMYKNSSIIILKGPHDHSRKFWAESNSGFEKVFESTYIAPIFSISIKTEVIRSYFDWIAPNYFLAIEKKKNLSCYESLFGLASIFLGENQCRLLLDFGCGPGTILDTTIPNKTSEIIGYDISQTALQLAECKGLKVLPKESFGRKLYSLDVIISSYVMHYGCSTITDLKNLTSLMTKKTVWAMNFHKNMNYEFFTSQSFKAGLKMIKSPLDSDFGKLVLVSRSE